MYRLVIAENPSVAMSIAKVLGAAARKEGHMEGGGWLVSRCIGHLAGLDYLQALYEKNLFGSFDMAATERQQEQAKIEARVTGQAAPPEPKGRAVPLVRPRKRMDATSMTISISQADKDLVKSFAFRHALTVSDLVHTWINEHCTEE